MNAHIDWELSLKLLNNNEKAARELLDMLVASLPEVAAQVQQAFSTQDLAALEGHVHKLHGGTNYVGVPLLQQASAKLERYLKSNEADTEVIRVKVQQLLEEITHVQNAYDEFTAAKQ